MRTCTLSATTMKLPANIFGFVLTGYFATAEADTVALFTDKGCDGSDQGVACYDIDDPLACCAAPEGSLYVAVGEDGHWAYIIQNGDRCGVILGSDENCFSADNGLEVISGGSVVGIADTAQSSKERKVVTADTWFYRNGTTEYTIPTDSEEGKQLAFMKDRDDRAALFVGHGKAVELVG